MHEPYRPRQVGRLPGYSAADARNALPAVVILIVIVIMVAVAVRAAIAVGVIVALVPIAVVTMARLHNDALLDVWPRIDGDGGRRDDDRPRRRIRPRRWTVVGVVDRRSDDAPAEREREADERAD